MQSDGCSNPLMPTNPTFSGNGGIFPRPAFLLCDNWERVTVEQQMIPFEARCGPIMFSSGETDILRHKLPLQLFGLPIKLFIKLFNAHKPKIIHVVPWNCNRESNLLRKFHQVCSYDTRIGREIATKNLIKGEEFFFPNLKF